MNDYVERLTKKGVEDVDLDDVIHDLKSGEAADINNSGLSDQVKYVVEAGARNELESLLA